MAQANWWDAAPVVTGGPLPSPPKPIEPEKPKDPPSGYQWTAAGGLAPIPGGPADHSTKPGGTEKPSQVPDAPAKRAEERVGQYVSLDNSASTFQDDFGGNPLGGLENTAQKYSPIDVGTPGQQQWWAAFRSTDNQIRNDLFGSALTAGEKAAYEETTISPGMRPELIRQNVERRRDIIKAALERQREFMVSNGYRPEAVDALFAPIVQKQDDLAAGAKVAESEKAPALAAPNYNPADPTQRPIAGAGLDNGGDGAQQLSAGKAQRADNPVLAGVRAEYVKRLQEGATAADLIAWARSAGIDPSANASIRAQADFRDKNPNVPIEQYDTSQLDDQFVPLSTADRALNAVAQSAPGAAAIAAGDAYSGFNLDSIVGATGGNAERARVGMQQVSEKHPVASTIGTIGGGVGAALGIEGGLAMGGLRAGLGRGLAADAIYGAGAGAGATDYAADGSPATLQDRAIGAAKGAGAGVIGSYAGSKIGGGLSAMARGVSDPSVRAMQEIGPVTLGQQVGRSGKIGAAIKGVEDRLAGLPVIGDAINARRTEGIEAMNSAAFDRALKPIGGSVGDKLGEEAMQLADQAVSDAYGKALKGKVVQADPEFAKDFTGAVISATKLPRVGEEVAAEIQDIVAPYMAPGSQQLTAEAMQQISRDLRAYKAAWANDTASRRVGKAIDAVEDSIFGMFRRQAPEVLPEYNKAKLAAQRLFTVERAVLAGKNTEGVFTPAQLGTADKQATIAYGGRRKTSTGKGEFHDFQRNAQNVLPNKIPDSGTAGRLLVPALAIGGGVGADQLGDTGGAGLTLGLILAGAYTKAGQRLLTKPGRGMSGKTGRLLEKEATRKAIRAGTASSAAALTSQ